MIRYFTTFILIVGLSGCAAHKNHPELTGLYTLDSLVNTIGNIQSAAIQLEAAKQMPQSDTYQIISYCNVVLKTIRESRNEGWRSAVLLATDELLSKPEFKRFRIELLIVEDLVQGIR